MPTVFRTYQALGGRLVSRPPCSIFHASNSASLCPFSILTSSSDFDFCLPLPLLRILEIILGAPPSRLSPGRCRGLRGLLLPLAGGEPAPLCHQMHDGRRRRHRLPSGPLLSGAERPHLPVRPRSSARPSWSPAHLSPIGPGARKRGGGRDL